MVFSSKKTWAVDAATSGVLITLSWVKMSSWTFCEDQDVIDDVTMKIKTSSMMLMKMLMTIIMMLCDKDEDEDEDGVYRQLSLKK